MCLITIKKYKNIIIAVGVIAILFSVYFIGTCNGKRHNKPTTVDSLAAQIKTEQAEKKVLLKTIADLQARRLQDSLKLLQEANAEQNIIVVYNNTQDSARKLKLTPAVNLMADNINAKGKITMLYEAKDTLVCIPSKAVYNVNSTYILNDYFAKENSSLEAEIFLYKDEDSTCTQIIDNYKLVINKDTIISNDLKIENNKLQTQLTKMTKQYKHQRFFKEVMEGVAGVAIIYSILK